MEMRWGSWEQCVSSDYRDSCNGVEDTVGRQARQGRVDK